MGMFDKDKEIGRQLTTVFNVNDEFVLWSAQVDDDAIPTDLGPADKTRLIVSRVDKPGDKFEVSTLASAIADKARQAEDSDFPAVVQLLQVDSKKHGTSATVLQFVGPYSAT